MCRPLIDELCSDATRIRALVEECAGDVRIQSQFQLMFETILKFRGRTALPLAVALEYRFQSQHFKFYPLVCSLLSLLGQVSYVARVLRFTFKLHDKHLRRVYLGIGSFRR